MSDVERKAIGDAVDSFQAIAAKAAGTYAPDPEYVSALADASILIKQFLCDFNRAADCLEVIAEKIPASDPLVFQAGGTQKP